MTATIKKFHLAALLVLIALGTYLAADYLAVKRTAQLQEEIEKKLVDQQATLKILSETTARNGADEITQGIVRDCNVEERKEFDVLLGRLDEGLAQGELQTLDRLFGRCGYFFAQRKSIMVARLKREVEMYEQLVAQLETLSDTNKQDSYMVEPWKNLARDEEKQSILFMDLVRTQDSIIATLLSGKSATGSEIQTILNEVKEIQETLAVTNMQTADLRATLLAQ